MEGISSACLHHYESCLHHYGYHQVVADTHMAQTSQYSKPSINLAPQP